MGDCIFEWTIANFGYWNIEVHGPSILSPFFSLSGRIRQFELFCNSDGSVEVKSTGDGNPFNHPKYSGNFSLVDSEGFVIGRTTEMSWYDVYSFAATFPGLNISDLTARTREKEADHPNQITVRCWLRNFPYEAIERIDTTIEVCKISVKVPSEKLNDLIEGNPIQVIRFSLEDDKDNDRLHVKLLEKDNTYFSVLEFFGKSRKKILVSICMSVVNKYDGVLKNIIDEPKFISDGEKKAWNSLAKGKDCSLLMNLKIIPPKSYNYRSHFYVDKGIYVVLPDSLQSVVSLEKSASFDRSSGCSHEKNDECSEIALGKKKEILS